MCASTSISLAMSCGLLQFVIYSLCKYSFVILSQCLQYCLQCVFFSLNFFTNFSTMPAEHPIFNPTVLAARFLLIYSSSKNSFVNISSYFDLPITKPLGKCYCNS